MQMFYPMWITYRGMSFPENKYKCLPFGYYEFNEDYHWSETVGYGDVMYCASQGFDKSANCAAFWMAE